MHRSQEPKDPIAAVVHADPYPYYARLARDVPLGFDPRLGLWVAAGLPAVQAALAHPMLRVRPPGEPVPKALQGTPVGEVFRLLVRMNDGEFHAREKGRVEHVSARWALARVAEAAAESALRYAALSDPNLLTAAVPVRTMARVLGVPAAELGQTTARVLDLAAALGLRASPQVISRAGDAATFLMARGRALGLDEPAAANRIAFMQQATDATAGLIGNAARALLARELPPVDSVAAWRAAIADIAHADPAVHNTRRWAAADVELEGHRVREGDCVLVVLASAVDSDGRRAGFGAGAHACPGEAIAVEIAASALRTLAACGELRRQFLRGTGFRALANARVPVFATPARSKTMTTGKEATWLP